MSDVHNEWNSPRPAAPASPPSPAAAPAAPAASASPAAPTAPSTRPGPPSAAPAPRRGSDARLLVGLGALAALLVLFVLVLAGRDASSTSCTIPWSNRIARSEGGDITVTFIDDGERPARCTIERATDDSAPSRRPED